VYVAHLSSPIDLVLIPFFRRDSVRRQSCLDLPMFRYRYLRIDQRLLYHLTHKVSLYHAFLRRSDRADEAIFDRAGSRITRSRYYRRKLAAYRWIESSQPKAIGWIRFPTVGVISLIAIFWLFICSEFSLSPNCQTFQADHHLTPLQSGPSLKLPTIAHDGTSVRPLSRFVLVSSPSRSSRSSSLSVPNGT